MHTFLRVRSRATLIVALAALTLVTLTPLAALADGGNPGVARVSVIDGMVAIERGDSATPVRAAINAPVLGADEVTTGPGSRAEIQFDGTSMVRLGGDVEVRFTHLDRGNREMQLAQGTLVVRLFRGTDGTSTIDTPSISIRPQESGTYRITVTGDGQTVVTVRSGSADIITPQGDQTVAPGATLIASGDASNPVVNSNNEIARDGFDAFNRERDAYVERGAANAYDINPAFDDAGDFAHYGRWVDDRTYGNVWIPANTSSNWAPYRDGRWVWEGDYGWTWVADEPWGWAPYHYGSWYHSPAYGWAWCPPGIREDPVWRPALVAFFAFGGGSGFSFGFGQNIGWVPLAPYEPYYPWYGGSTIVNNTTNITNNYYVNNVANTNLTHVYRNVQSGGVTSVSKQRFIEGRFERTVSVQAQQLRRVDLVRGALPVVPTTKNLRFVDRSVNSALGVRAAVASRVFAGNPSVTQRIPFEQTRTAIAASARVPVNGPPVIAPKPTSNSWSRFNAQRGTLRTNPVSAPRSEPIREPYTRVPLRQNQPHYPPPTSTSRLEAVHPPAARREPQREPAPRQAVPQKEAPRATSPTPQTHRKVVRPPNAPL